MASIVCLHAFIFRVVLRLDSFDYSFFLLYLSFIYAYIHKVLLELVNV